MVTDLFGWVGTVVERYRVDAVARETRLGLVYRGMNERSATPVAIEALKIPPHFTPGAREVVLARFREAGRIVIRFDRHDALARMLDWGLHDGLPYQVFEPLGERSLEEHLAQQGGSAPMSETDALEIMLPVVEAIALAHSGFIDHRDIRPATILVTSTKHGLAAKVMDLGIVKALQAGEAHTQEETQTLSPVFSSPYTAPEQIHPESFGPAGPWSDVYALGVLLRELLPRPEHGFEADQRGGYRNAPETRQPATPAGRAEKLAAVCARAVATHPGERYPDAHHLLEALRTAAPRLHDRMVD